MISTEIWKRVPLKAKTAALSLSSKSAWWCPLHPLRLLFLLFTYRCRAGLPGYRKSLEWSRAMGLFRHCGNTRPFSTKTVPHLLNPLSPGWGVAGPVWKRNRCLSSGSIPNLVLRTVVVYPRRSRKVSCSARGQSSGDRRWLGPPPYCEHKWHKSSTMQLIPHYIPSLGPRRYDKTINWHEFGSWQRQKCCFHWPWNSRASLRVETGGCFT
jgi:hypothetical protein